MPKLRNAVYLLVATSSVAIAAYQPQVAAPVSYADLTPQLAAPVVHAVAGKSWHEAQARPGAKLE